MDFILLTLEDYVLISIPSYLPLLVLFGKLSEEQELKHLEKMLLWLEDPRM
ncbi:hypothetical protein Celaphus_00017396 [Cervus elaphus hippelaphus]|uniref:Uncharacterized protein n=1 Tax=Cervus elaphus hippelaphus TaxID=46360 RepID=A0A212D5U8_CEREH|nr:hypothetical protein Celaphus_00017396 [Cervus elaphus hippelaphus]